MKNEFKKNSRTLTIWLNLMKIGAQLGCHQKPERSFFLKGYQFPVCARCTGLLFGFIAGIIGFWWILNSVRLAMICCIPLIIDGITQYLGWRESNQILRVVTGILGGFGISILELWGLKELIGGVIYEVSQLW